MTTEVGLSEGRPKGRVSETHSYKHLESWVAVPKVSTEAHTGPAGESRIIWGVLLISRSCTSQRDTVPA